MSKQPKVAIIGGGFTGLSAGYELSKHGIEVEIFEADKEVGGLAGSFMVGNEYLEKFYHHWFTNDKYVIDLVEDLKLQENIVHRETRTGMFFSNNFYKLSSPLDLLKFRPLSLLDRIRLGLVVLKVRSIKDWKELEGITAVEWLKKICGPKVYKIMWEPLLIGKFGKYADKVSAVWFWNKLKLRGGSRGKNGKEVLAYYKGGFASLANSVADKIKENGGKIHTGVKVKSLLTENKVTKGLVTESGDIVYADCVLGTTSLPIISNIVSSSINGQYLEKINSIEYLGNVCLVLQLNKSLTDLYWLNVNDPGFPFVGIIEHTNFEPASSYDGTKIVYLSKYLPVDEELYSMTEEEVLKYSIPYIKKMFPDFDEKSIIKYHVWKAEYSQPIVTKHYSAKIPDFETPLPNFYISTMAQIYPEDRGTNYAIREGIKSAHKILELVKQ